MALSIRAIIDEICSRVGLNKDDAATRARILAAANDAERAIAAPASFLYLARAFPLEINHNAASVALPTNPAIDFGKKMSLRINGVPGYLRYYPHDRFRVGAISTAYSFRRDRPASWTVMRNAAGTMTVFVDPPNTTGGNITLELVAQMAVQPLIDDPASFSLLPEGYESTLLAKRTEAEMRRQLSRPGWKAAQDDFDAFLQAFYAAQRTSKEDAATDPETMQRKRSDVDLDPEA